jgi:hypothetical protein
LRNVDSFSKDMFVSHCNVNLPGVYRFVFE